MSAGGAALAHGMADPVVRRRVAALTAALLGITWILATVGGRAGGPFGPTELRDLSGIPVPPPQIESRFKQDDPVDDFSRQFEDLRDRVAGVPTELQPSE